ncbi:unnamed protein product [Periconia digitata]|uniref:Uncharacterized protein n=1 Tax=Periconia digitata TaxID=1303443 RepID=A0A9W4XXU4_9PLEO|nr:unnamed protein product [Periconia digitata]
MLNFLSLSDVKFLRGSEIGRRIHSLTLISSFINHLVLLYNLLLDTSRHPSSLPPDSSISSSSGEYTTSPFLSVVTPHVTKSADNQQQIPRL